MNKQETFCVRLCLFNYFNLALSEHFETLPVILVSFVMKHLVLCECINRQLPWPRMYLLNETLFKAHQVELSFLKLLHVIVLRRNATISGQLVARRSVEPS